MVHYIVSTTRVKNTRLVGEFSLFSNHNIPFNDHIVNRGMNSGNTTGQGAKISRNQLLLLSLIQPLFHLFILLSAGLSAEVETPTIPHALKLRHSAGKQVVIHGPS